MSSIGFSIDTESKIKKYKQLYDSILESIQNGTLQPGSKLTSIRTLSQKSAISKNTVAKAYEELEKNGYIYSESKKGYFVAKQGIPKIPSVKEKVQTESSVPTVDSILKQYKPTDTETILPNSDTLEKALQEGILSQSVPKQSPTPPAEAVAKKGSNEEQLLESYNAVLLSNKDALSQEIEPFGQIALRRAIASFAQKHLGIKAAAEQIVVAAGQEHLLSALLHLKPFCTPSIKSDGLGLMHLAKQISEGSVSTINPAAAVSEPTEQNLRQIFIEAGIPVREIPIDDQGMCFDFLVTSGATTTFVTPADIPVGALEANTERIHDILEWAGAVSYRHIIEFDTNPLNCTLKTYKSADKIDKVVYLHSFKHLISNAINAAFAILPEDINDLFVAKYKHLKCSLSLVEQLALTHFLTHQ